MKSCDGRFISPKSTFNWGGDDPDDWYPMDMRFSCVVVSSGSTFSGWGTYISTLEVKSGTCLPSSISGSSPEPIVFSVETDNSAESVQLDLTELKGPSDFKMTNSSGANWTATWQPPSGLNMGTYGVGIRAESANEWGFGSITVEVSGALADDFSGGSLDSWTIGQGSWAIDGGELTNSSEGRTSLWTGPAIGNLAFSADVTPVDDANVWMIFRVQDSLNYYLFTLGNFIASASTTGVGRLFKLEDGMYRMVAAATNASFTTGTTYGIRIEAVGENFKVYSDGVLILEGSDTSYTSGYTGFGSNNGLGRFDNMVVNTDFTTTAIEGRVVVEAEDVIRVSPNPFNPSTKIDVSFLKGLSPETEYNTNVHVKIFDLKGNFVAHAQSSPSLNSDSEKHFDSWHRTFRFNAIKKPSGIYLVIAEVGEKRYCKRIVLHK